MCPRKEENPRPADRVFEEVDGMGLGVHSVSVLQKEYLLSYWLFLHPLQAANKLLSGLRSVSH
jgi:hypothetical protein